MTQAYTPDASSVWDGRKPPLILALSGGGFRGYFTALVLAHLEERLGSPCHKIFNLIAGTSIGGIIAIGLAFGIPAKRIADVIATSGPAIFPPLRFKTLRRTVGPPYSSKPIEDAVRQLLPPAIVDGPLTQALQNIMVITASPSTARMEAFSSWNNQNSISVRDAALATSAAPTYFPAHRARVQQSEIDLIDGGIAANAPDAVAIHCAIKELSFPVEKISLLSVGTCSPVEGGAASRRPYRSGLGGALRNLGGRGIVNLMMAIQEERGISDASDLLGPDRYLRLDKPASRYQSDILELDDASPRSRLTLGELAKAASDDHAAKQSHGVWQLLRARAQSLKPSGSASS